MYIYLYVLSIHDVYILLELYRVRVRVKGLYVTYTTKYMYSSMHPSLNKKQATNHRERLLSSGVRLLPGGAPQDILIDNN